MKAWKLLLPLVLVLCAAQTASASGIDKTQPPAYDFINGWVEIPSYPANPAVQLSNTSSLNWIGYWVEIDFLYYDINNLLIDGHDYTVNLGAVIKHTTVTIQGPIVDTAGVIPGSAWCDVYLQIYSNLANPVGARFYAGRIAGW
jgi:hypothetical protein